MKLTVFMPVYNREKYLKDSISSILNQDFNDFELLIIDDGSTDRSIEVIESFNDNRIRLLKNLENKGVVFTRNRGIEEARGEYILLLDSDDIALPGRLSKQVRFIEAKPDAAITSSAYIAAYPDGSIIKRHIIEDTDLINPMMIFKNCVGNSSCIIRKEYIINNNIRYRDSFFYGEDYAFFVDILKYSKIYGQDEVLSIFNYSSDNSITAGILSRREEVTKNIMFKIRKTYLENNNINLEDNKIMCICKATAQPTLMEYNDIIRFINTLEEIKIKNSSFDKEKLRSVLEDMTHEIIYFSQKVNYINKVNLLKKHKASYILRDLNKRKLFIYHIKFNLKKAIREFKLYKRDITKNN